jgi:hypothetical protein
MLKPIWVLSSSLAVEKRVGTMLELLEDEPRPRQKPKMEVLMVKSAEVGGCHSPATHLMSHVLCLLGCFVRTLFSMVVCYRG